jgi:hypothetical protein
MQEYPYYSVLEKQSGKCSVCGNEITPGEYCAVNTSQGVKVIHSVCLRALTVDGCQAQIEVLFCTY